MKRFLNLATLSLAVAVGIAVVPQFSGQAIPQSQPMLLSQVNFQPPDVTAPGNRQGGTHRGTGVCPAGLSITPLMPPSNIGLTTEDAPTFFVYVPKTSAKVEFTLLNEKEDDVVYETSLNPVKQGIIGVSLPAPGEGRKMLEVGKRYVWSFSMICDPNDRSADLVVKGWVQRVEPQPTLKTNLETSDARARLSIYANNGFWYETLATLAELRRSQPEDQKLATEWTQLLQSQGLEAISDQPLVSPQ